MRSVIALVFLASNPSSCMTPDYPGEPVGSFDMVGSLASHECGETAVSVPNPLEFRVELRSEQSLAYWRLPSRPVVSGVVDEEGRFEFQTSALVQALPADPDLGVVGCALVQRERVEVQLIDEEPSETEEEPPMRSLTGINSIEISPAPGSDCSPLLGSLGGPFAALPCAVTYDLIGTEREAIP